MSSLFNEDLPFNVSPSENDEDDAIDYEDPTKTENNVNWTTPNYNNNNNNSGYTNPWAPQQPISNPFFQPTGGFYQPQPIFQPQQTNNNGNYPNLPRGKRIVVCDFLDNIVENWTATAGIPPRGIYDLKPKFEFWHKLKEINPEYVIVCTNQGFATRDAEDFSYTVGYFLKGLTQFMNIPKECCIFSGKESFDKDDYFVKPNPGLLLKALKLIGISDINQIKNDIIIVGYNSGLPGKSDIDLRMAKTLGIEYIDYSAIIKYI